MAPGSWPGKSRLTSADFSEGVGELSLAEAGDIAAPVPWLPLKAP